MLFEQQSTSKVAFGRFDNAKKKEREKVPSLQLDSSFRRESMQTNGLLGSRFAQQLS